VLWGVGVFVARIGRPPPPPRGRGRGGRGGRLPCLGQYGEHWTRKKSCPLSCVLLAEQITKPSIRLLHLLDRTQHAHPTNSQSDPEGGGDLSHRNNPEDSTLQDIAMRSSNSFRRLSARKATSYIKQLRSVLLSENDD
jgi:hypothetical protein